MNGATGKIARLGVLIGLTALTVSGCASPFKAAQVDPSSPIADATRAAAGQKGRRPSFSDIPAVPTDVRGPARIKAVVEAEQLAAAKLRRDAAPETFKLTDTEGYAARARAAAKAPDFGAPTDADRAETEAFAAAARGRASAPSSQPK
jgi:hypothetical protein